MPIIKILLVKDMDMVGLDEACKRMRLREDANGDSLNITPAFVLVPAAGICRASRHFVIVISLSGW